MLIINPIIMISTLVIFIGSYFLISKRIQKTIHINSKIIAENNIKQMQIIRESLGSIIEIILSQSHSFHINKFRKVDIDIRNRERLSRFLVFFPKSILESATFIMLAGISFIFTLISINPIYLINLIGIFALSAQKLLPLLQQAYANLTSIKSQSYAIKGFLDLLRSNKENLDKKTKKDLPILNKNISLKNIYFKYQDDLKFVLSDLNLIIKKGDKVGIIGETGSGKTTFISILLGLIKPDNGALFIDDLELHDPKNIEYLNSWRQSISYVPQKLFLKNTSVSENILFGDIANNLTLEKVDKVAKTAYAHEFINLLPEKFNTFVGDNGSFLSQGQKQRIGIARALYRDPKVVILDEATSSLDEITEKKIISSIHNKYEELTLIMIAHKLKTLAKCDYIIEIKDGRIKRKIYPNQYNEILFKK